MSGKKPPLGSSPTYRGPNFRENLLNDPLTPYFFGCVVWFGAWFLQMDLFRPYLNFAPGVELPFFPAGVRTLAVFIFGFAGAVGIFMGSLITYFMYFPELSSAAPFHVIIAAAASAFSAYLAMQAICTVCKIPHTLDGLTLRNISWIVVTQSLLSASLHQIVYHQEAISEIHATPDMHATLFNWAAMASGDALGSMAVLFSVLGIYLFYSRSH